MEGRSRTGDSAGIQVQDVSGVAGYSQMDAPVEQSESLEWKVHVLP